MSYNIYPVRQFIIIWFILSDLSCLRSLHFSLIDLFKCNWIEISDRLQFNEWIFGFSIVIIDFCSFFFLQHSSLCHLGRGVSFGDSVLDDSPRDSTALTRGRCRLLRVEQRDFRPLWEVNFSLLFAFCSFLSSPTVP